METALSLPQRLGWQGSVEKARGWPLTQECAQLSGRGRRRCPRTGRGPARPGCAVRPWAGPERTGRRRGLARSQFLLEPRFGRRRPRAGGGTWQRVFPGGRPSLGVAGSSAARAGAPRGLRGQRPSPARL